MYNIPGGMDWSKPVTIKAYDPANRPVVRPVTGADRVVHFQNYAGQVVHHIIIDGFVLDGANVTYDTVKITGGAHHIRLMNSEVRNAPHQGILVTAVGSDYNEFFNLDVHHNGQVLNKDHGFYIATKYNIVDHCDVHNNFSFGVHIYNEYQGQTADENVVRNNRLHNNDFGFILSSGSGNMAYNNLVYANATDGARIAYINPVNSKVYNNTFYGNGGAGINIFSTSGMTYIENNISVGNGAPDITNGVDGSVGTTTIKNNLVSRITDAAGTAIQSGNIIGANPLLVNAAGLDFHLQAGSPAINSALTLAEVTSDFDGVSRPQQAAYDIGAYERSIP
jgi:parallel beta-helix repeat protein